MLFLPQILHAFFAFIVVARGASVPLDTRQTNSYAYEVGGCDEAQTNWCELAGAFERNYTNSCNIYS